MLEFYYMGYDELVKFIQNKVDLIYVLNLVVLGVRKS